MIRYFLITFLLAVVPAHAQVTITNFNGAGTGFANRISIHDTSGNALDSHQGNTIQVGSTFYVYGEHYACGYRSGTNSPFCGFRVHSTTDFRNFTDLGYIFDASTTYWQNRCKGIDNSGNGCYQPTMVYNAANNNYVLWFNQVGGTPTATQNNFVMVCSQPFSTPATIATNCTQQADPSGITHCAAGARGALNIAVDPNTNIAYGIFNEIATRHICIEQLNAAYTDSTGTGEDLGVTGEGDMLFVRSGVWYALYGPDLCAYCSGGVQTVALQASSPLGTYGSPVQLNVNSCGGQNSRGVTTVVAGASTTYLFSVDQWTGQPNEGWATIYWQPLSFIGSAIQAFSCNTTVTIPGLTLAGAYPTPAFTTPTPDQTDVQDSVFNDRCDINGTQWRLQTFVPSVAALAGIAIPIGQNTPFSGGCSVGSPCSGVDGSLEVDIVNISGGVPTTTIASATISPSALQWSTQWTDIPFNITLTPATMYGILLKGAGTTTTTACYSTTASQNNNVYPAGAWSASSNSGASWAVQAGFAYMFSTFPPSPPHSGGGRRGVFH